MSDTMTTTEDELAADLLQAGVFRSAWFPEGCGFPEDEVTALPDGWNVVLSKDTAAAEAIYRIAGAIDVTVPVADLAKAVVKHILHQVPSVKELFTSYPTTAALDTLASYLGAAPADKDGYDLGKLDEIIEMTPDEEKLHALLVATLDGNCPAARLVHLFGKSGKRTWFNDHFLPTVPFIIHDKGFPVRLVGFQPHPKLHKNDDDGRFVGIEISEDGQRCVLEFIVSEQAVEGNSFNVPVAAKAAVAGKYTEVRSDISLTFSLDRKNARKFSGMGRVVRKLYPEYIAGQAAFVVLDKSTGEALIELHDSNDYDARTRMRSMLKEGISVPPSEDANLQAIEALSF